MPWSISSIWEHEKTRESQAHNWLKIGKNCNSGKSDRLLKWLKSLFFWHFLQHTTTCTQIIHCTFFPFLIPNMCRARVERKNYSTQTSIHRGRKNNRRVCSYELGIVHRTYVVVLIYLCLAYKIVLKNQILRGKCHNLWSQIRKFWDRI